MKIKVSTATGAVLDCLVAMCEGYDCQFDDSVSGPWLVPQDGYWQDEKPLSGFNPSTNWAHGGRLIEREGIDLYWLQHGTPDFKASWQARKVTTQHHQHMLNGSTPLIAAMRCYVFNKLGEEVDLPEGTA